MKLAIEMSEEERKRLRDVADRLNIPMEALAEAAIRDLVSRPSEDFEDVAERLLAKHRELYERLR